MAVQVTEDFILNLTGKEDLKKIKSLSLENLEISSIDGDVFSKMKNLSSLDLSSNNIQEIPTNLVLCSLNKLNICDNKLTSTEFVAQFPQLQELYVEGNPLEPSDKYIAHLLCPTLENVDRMKVDTMARMTQNMKNRLRPQVAAAWEAQFAARFSGGISHNQLGKVTQEFLDLLKTQKFSSPTTYKKYTDFMVDQLGQEVIEEVATGSYKQSKRPRERVDYRAMSSPTKNQTQNSPATPNNNSITFKSPAASPKFGNPFRSPRLATPVKSASPTKRAAAQVSPKASPMKKAKMSSKAESPTKRSTATSRERSSPRNAASRQLTSPLNEKQDNSFKSIKSPQIYSLPQMPDYDPKYFVRCHFGGSADHGDNDPTDDETQVWKCEFEPNPHKPGQTTNVVATCGGHVVCLLDCNTGRVLKRLKHDSQHFYTLAWTTVKMKSEGRDWPTNILAVAGVQGHVKLLHPDQLVCYAEFQVKSHPVKYISWMLFHPESPTVLFCGDYSGSITVWDIGLPEGRDYRTNVKLLATLKCCKESITNMILSKPTGHLVVGSENGCYAWNANVTRLEKMSRTPEKELIFCKAKDSHVDGLCLIAEDIAAIKVIEQGCIWLWRLSTTLNSKAATIKVNPLAVLDYKKTSNCYMSISSCADVLLSGDDNGNIVMYDVSTFVKDKSAKSDWPLRPSKTLQWPECVLSGKRHYEEVMIDLLDLAEPLIVNSVAVNHNRTFVVATTDNNMVCIWKKSS